MLEGCSFLFQIVTSKRFLLLYLRKIMLLIFFKEKWGKHLLYCRRIVEVYQIN